MTIDESGKPSLSKTMPLHGWLSMPGFMFKMTATKTITIEYFIVYCAFVSGQH